MELENINNKNNNDDNNKKKIRVSYNWRFDFRI